MKDKGNQTIFIAGSIADIYREIESEHLKQKKMLDVFVQKQHKPVNDLWIASAAQAIGKIAKSVEDNNFQTTRSLVIKFISQLLIWLDLFENQELDDVTLSNEKIHNPSFNTILVKLLGELSRETLRNKNKIVQEKLAVFRAFCDQWLDRFKETDASRLHSKTYSKQMTDEFWQTGDSKLENLEEIFSEVE